MPGCSKLGCVGARVLECLSARRAQTEGEFRDATQIVRDEADAAERAAHEAIGKGELELQLRESGLYSEQGLMDILHFPFEQARPNAFGRLDAREFGSFRVSAVGVSGRVRA